MRRFSETETFKRTKEPQQPNLSTVMLRELQRIEKVIANGWAHPTNKGTAQALARRGLILHNTHSCPNWDRSLPPVTITQRGLAVLAELRQSQ